MVREASSRDHLKFTPPDGGFGWVIVLAAFMSQFWIIGFMRSYSIFYVEIIKTFPDSSAYQASLIPAFLMTTGMMLGMQFFYSLHKY